MHPVPNSIFYLFITAHAANILFSLIRHQATRGAIGWLSRPSGAIKKDRWRSRLGMLMKKAELL